MKLLDELVLIHISDVHFGEAIQSEFGWEQRVPGLNRLTSMHHIKLCRGLQVALKNLPRRLRIPTNVPVHLVVTGDITRRAKEAEFCTAYTFLGSEFLLGIEYAGRVGLDIPQERRWVIPGNHDHYGAWLWPAQGRNPNIYDQYFVKPPWRERIHGPGYALSVDLVGLDTNSGLQGRTWSAKGSIDKDKGLNDARLENSSPKIRDHRAQIAVILAHHTLEDRAFGDAQPLVPESRTKLIEFAKEQSCPIVLTGHAHVFGRGAYPKMGPPTLLEFRSPTTLQGPPRAGVQGFLVHGLRAYQNKSRDLVEWRTWLFVWGGYNGRMGEQFAPSASRKPNAPEGGPKPEVDPEPMDVLWWDVQAQVWLPEGPRT